MAAKPDSPFWQRLETILSSQLDPKHRMVLVALWKFLGDNDRAFPKQPALAAAVGVPVRELQRLVKGLREAGIVSTERGLNVMTYQVDWQAVESAEPIKPKQRGKPIFNGTAVPANGGVNVPANDGGNEHDSSRERRRDVPANDGVSNAGGTAGTTYIGNSIETPLKPQRQRKTAAGDSVSIPEGLQMEDFQAAWSDWLAYRRERRLSARPMTLSRQLKKLAEIGPERATQCIDTSITNGWAGLFPERIQQNSRNGSERIHQQMRDFAAWAAEDDE